MTSEYRQYLKDQVDHAKRERLAKAHSNQERCGGCGGERNAMTTGCRSCHDRIRRRGYRRNR